VRTVEATQLTQTGPRSNRRRTPTDQVFGDGVRLPYIKFSHNPTF